MEPVKLVLERLLGMSVTLAPLDRKKAYRAAKALKPGEVLMLENLRFDPGEKSNSQEFIDYLASLADLVVNEAFGAMHRKHASIDGVARKLPSYAGFLVAKEVEAFQRLLNPNLRNLTLVLGGAKVADKIPMIEQLLDKTRTILVGGAMCYTFLAAQGYSVGKCLVDTENLEYVRGLIRKADARGIRIVLPTDIRLTNGTVCDVSAIPSDGEGLDIGERTYWSFMREIEYSDIVFWNGTMGVSEIPMFELGTMAVAYAIALNRDAFTVVGGGDTAAAVKRLGIIYLIDHVSTGGGASLKLIEKGTLVGLEALGYAA
jgi:phosphoglycerate kinase